MFKKTLLALAIAGMSIGSQAATSLKVDAVATTATGVTVTDGSGADKQITVSAQGVAGAGSIDFGANLGLQLVIDDADGDKGYNTMKSVTVTLSNGTFHPSSAPTINFMEDADASVVVFGTPLVGVVSYPAAGNQVVFTFDAADRTSMIAETGSNGTTASSADTFIALIAGLAVSNDLAAGTDINATVEIISEVGATVIDTASVKFASVVNQFSVTVTDTLTDKLNVAKGRKQFVTGDAGAAAGLVNLTQDTTVNLVQTAIDLNAAVSAGATSDDLTVSINGDFTYADADADDKVDTNFTATGYQKGGQSLKVITTSPSITAAAATDATSFNVVTDGNVALSSQSFTYDLSVSYNNASLTDGVYTASGSVGSWTLNGATASVPFMPFGDAFSQSITVTNVGSVDGAIVVDWFFNGTEATTPLTLTAAANSVTDISAEVRALAAANGITGNAALKIIINSPNDDITVKGVYYSKADKDRAVVL